MDITLRWNQLIHDPLFRDMPYKIELNKSGQILMSPASNWHGHAQGELAKQFGKKKKSGKIIAECSILTRLGVRVADIAWASDSFIAKNGFTTPYLVSPELCVEIVSPGNSQPELSEKVALYLEKGAHEVWIVAQNGKMKIFGNVGEQKKSTIIPGVTL